MKTASIRHEEAMIRHFMADPEFAEMYLEAVSADGDEREKSIVRSWYEEAHRRSYLLSLEKRREPSVEAVMA